MQRIIDERGISKTEFARSLGVTTNYVYRIFQGDRAGVSLSLAKLIETIYGYPAEWVRGGDPDFEIRAEIADRIKTADTDEIRSIKALLDEMDELNPQGNQKK
jgi:transcriptional regulator with XRE-family HTH domain